VRFRSSAILAKARFLVSFEPLGSDIDSQILSCHEGRE